MLSKEQIEGYLQEIAESLQSKQIDGEFILCGGAVMKLAAARIEGRDKEDTLFLMKHLDVKSLDQVYEILEKNIHPSQLTAQVSLFTQAMYQEYDEGRQSPSASDSMARAQQGAKALCEDTEPQVGIEGKTR